MKNKIGWCGMNNEKINCACGCGIELWNINNGITLCKECHKYLYQNNKRKEVREK